MTMLEFIILVLPIPLASLYLSTILIRRFAAHILLERYSFNLNSVIYGRLFQLISLYQNNDILFKILFIFLICGSGYEEEGGSLGESYILFSDILSFQVSLLAAVPVIVYLNVETDKSTILSDNKGKAGIYQWKHNESGKIYIGSAFDLSKRFTQYFSPLTLKRVDNYISRAIFAHTHSAFSLHILELIDISKFTKEEARNLILEREQHFIDSLQPAYNILKVAGCLLGYKHSEESLAKISEALSGENNPMFGKNHSGVNNPMFGKSHSEEAKALMSNAKSSENNPMFGKCHSTDTKALMSIAKGGGSIYVYDSQGSLVNTFTSARNAAVEYDTTHKTIMRYVKNGKLFQEQWFLSLSAK